MRGVAIFYLIFKKSIGWHIIGKRDREMKAISDLIPEAMIVISKNLIKIFEGDSSISLSYDFQLPFVLDGQEILKGGMLERV